MANSLNGWNTSATTNIGQGRASRIQRATGQKLPADSETTPAGASYEWRNRCSDPASQRVKPMFRRRWSLRLLNWDKLPYTISRCG